MRVKKMGKKTDKYKGKAMEEMMKDSRKGKEPQLPPPKCGPTDQTALPNQASAWKMSTMKKEAIQELVDAKLLQEEAVVNWRCAYANAWNFEGHPKEIVIWAHFVERGLVVPISEFFRGIRNFYNIQLVHLNPYRILHITIFVHLCEAYLGI